MAKDLEVGGERQPNRWRGMVWGSAGVLLLLPLLAMQVTEEVAWDAFDFVLMGTLLFVACGTYELAARMTGNSAYRAGVGVAVVATFILIWINLAVGIIGSEDNPANLMFGGVLAIAIGGAVIARFKPVGMARTLVATAVAQMLVSVIALVLGEGFTVILNGFFAALWLMSASLFQKSARHQASAHTVS